MNAHQTVASVLDTSTLALEIFTPKARLPIKPDFRATLRYLLGTDQTVRNMRVTPEMAAVMLEYNTGNRTMSKLRVRRYAKDMVNADWKLTGEPIIFSAESILNDGQTRLAACVEAGVPFETDVRFGVAREAFQVTGIGRKRTLGDVYSINKEKSATTLAGALNWLHAYETNFASGKNMLHVQGLDMLVKHPGMRESVEIGLRMKREARAMTASMGGWLHYIFAQIDRRQADEFFLYLIDGISGGVTSKRDPRYLIRKKLMANLASKAKISDLEMAALTIKAWNLHRDRREAMTLKWLVNAATGKSEVFPRAK